MPEELSYRKLCDLFRDEKASNGICKLPGDFEKGAAEYLSHLEEGAKESHDAARERENSSRMLRQILRLRRQKVVFRALAGTAEHHAEGMTDEEHALYDRVGALVADEETRAEKLGLERISQKARKKEEEQAEQAIGDAFKKLRILKEIPSYHGADGKEWGPYKIGEEVSLPPSEADWMTRGRLAEWME